MHLICGSIHVLQEPFIGTHLWIQPVCYPSSSLLACQRSTTTISNSYCRKSHFNKRKLATFQWILATRSFLPPDFYARPHASFHTYNCKIECHHLNPASACTSPAIDPPEKAQHCRAPAISKKELPHSQMVSYIIPAAGQEAVQRHLTSATHTMPRKLHISRQPPSSTNSLVFARNTLSSAKPDILDFS